MNGEKSLLKKDDVVRPPSMGQKTGLVGGYKILKIGLKLRHNDLGHGFISCIAYADGLKVRESW